MGIYSIQHLSAQSVEALWLYLCLNCGVYVLVTLTLFSRSQEHFEMSKIWFPCMFFWTSGWILTKLAYIHCWEEGKSWLNIGDLYLIFKVTAAHWNVQNMVSVSYLMNQSMDFDQTRVDTFLGEGEELIRFWWPLPNFQGHTGSLWNV